VRLNPAADIGEDEFSWWAGDFPYSQGISDELAKGYLPLPSRRLRLADLVVPIRPLPDVDCAGLKSTSTHRSPRNSEERSPVKMAMISKGRQRPLALAIISRMSSGEGMSTPTLSLPFWRRSACRSFPFAPTLPQIADNVLSDVAALVGVGKDRAEAGEQFPHHCGRAAFLAQPAH